MGERSPETQRTSWISREIFQKPLRVVCATLFVAGAVSLTTRYVEQNPKPQKINPSIVSTATRNVPEELIVGAMAIDALLFALMERKRDVCPKDKPLS